MSRTVHVDLGERSYEIHIGSDLLPGGALAGEAGIRALIVSDSHVDPLYGARCEAVLRRQGIEPRRTVVPAGEASKELPQVQRLYEAALDAGLDRRSVIVALGGGMIGDLAGFVAATYLRGVRFVQVPTSLLAMVDSSVGGKTGINLPRGKNLVGAFYQPVEVTADMSVLESLPPREYRSGLAEVVKYGVIWDAEFFADLEAKAEGLLGREASLLEGVVTRCCEIKAEVVGLDERESGVRAVLNFGHTLAHALETRFGYRDLLHGEAIAVGMAFAAELSVAVKGFSREDGNRLIRLLRRLELPVSLSELKEPVTWDTVRDLMRSDKKARQSVPRFVLAERLGSVIFGCTVPEEVQQSVFASFPRE
jgi:3-dehydroquinate synthase